MRDRFARVVPRDEASARREARAGLRQGGVLLRAGRLQTGERIAVLFQYDVGVEPASSGGGTGQLEVFDLKQVLVALSQHCTEPDSEGQLFWQSESVEQDVTHCFGGGGVAVAVPVPAGMVVAGGVGSVGAVSCAGGSDVAHAARTVTRNRPERQMLVVRTGVGALYARQAARHVSVASQ